MPLFQFHLSVWFQLKIHQDSVQAIQLTWQKRKHFLTGKCPIQAIDGDIVKAIQLNHRKILHVETISVAVRKKVSQGVANLFLAAWSLQLVWVLALVMKQTFLQQSQLQTDELLDLQTEWLLLKQYDHL